MAKEKEPKKVNEEATPPVLEEAERVAEETADAKIAELENRYVRLMAEYDNFRKRSVKEKARLFDDATFDVVQKLLPVIDSLDRSVELAATVNGEAKAFADGIPLMAEQFATILQSLGVSRIEAMGAPFDPEHHHAVQRLESAEHESGTVIDVLQTGFLLGDRLIRPSLVVVAA